VSAAECLLPAGTWAQPKLQGTKESLAEISSKEHQEIRYLSYQQGMNRTTVNKKSRA